MYSLEIISEEIFKKNKEYKRELRLKWIELYPEVLKFCEEEGLMHLFAGPKREERRRPTKSPLVRRVG